MLGVAGGAVVATAPGCRDATQMTLAISLTPRAQCTEIHGTAITVGVDPDATEARIRDEYVTATTAACDPSSRSIGTLVLTPGDSDTASVVVVVAYDQVSPASCKPPAYKGCIVARRRFSFASHAHLAMPITIDPDCKDVPCDAFSTCRTGVCFTSEVSCSGDDCNEPGATPDGGTSEAGQITPDASFDGPPGDGATEAADAADASDAADVTDSGEVDGGGDASVGNGASCILLDQDRLHCGGLLCSGPTKLCCGAQPGDATTCSAAGACASKRYCCQSTDCPSGICLRAAEVIRVTRGANPNGGIGTCTP